MSQKQRILELMQRRPAHAVSAREAIYDMGITRLAAIVHELREEGFNIMTNGRSGELAIYTLVPRGQAPATPRRTVGEECECGHRQRPGFPCFAFGCPCQHFTPRET